MNKLINIPVVIIIIIINVNKKKIRKYKVTQIINMKCIGNEVRIWNQTKWQILCIASVRKYK